MGSSRPLGGRELPNIRIQPTAADAAAADAER